MQPTGSLFFTDEYGQQYESTWETANGLLDITTTTKQPFVWGEQNSGFIQGTTLFRRGVITIERSVIKIGDDPSTYTILADGTTQYIDFFQATFNCQTGPKDTFAWHCDCETQEEFEGDIIIGSHWVGTSLSTNEEDTMWGEIGTDGAVTGTDLLTWVNIWGA